MVWDREQTAGDIAADFTVSWPAVSQHLRILRDAGFVSERRDGKNRIYRAEKEALGNLRYVLEDEWDRPLARIRSSTESEERGDCE